MFGILAAIVAYKKGHSTYGTAMIIWMVIGIGLGAAGLPAIGPGIIFFSIALGMENLNEQNSAEAASEGTPEQTDVAAEIPAGDGQEKAEISALVPEVPAGEETGEETPLRSAVVPAKVGAFCRFCGAPLVEGSIFCARCGNKL